MPIETNEISKNAMGGTEIMVNRLYSSLDPDLLDKFQIIPSRFRNLEDEKIAIFWAHDTANDPESAFLKRKTNIDKFAALVFVSNYQLNSYAAYLGIPYSKSIVIENGIVPISEIDIQKPKDKIKLIYTSTPHRGLEILVPVFVELAKEFPNLELDVYSSFKLYGMEDRDIQFQKIFDVCQEHPQINYFGTVSNDEIRQAVAKAHIFAYPSVYAETSCLALIEAMSGACICVHPNYAALPDTSAGLTAMYQWSEDSNQHARDFYGVLRNAITNINHPGLEAAVMQAKRYADFRFNWDLKKQQWQFFLEGILQEQLYLSTQPKKEPTGEMFTIDTGF